MFIPEKLPEMITERMKNALDKGVLESIQTEKSILIERGVEFIIRVAVSFRKKWISDNNHKANYDPFLPYEQDLFVTDLSKTHICLLNKYNVLNNHILIVTRDYEEQTNFLTLNDFEAVFLCMTGLTGLIFYNSSETAGASQSHKHLQFIKIHNDEWSLVIPFIVLFNQKNYKKKAGQIIVLKELPYKHVFLWIGDQSKTCGARDYFDYYKKLIDAAEISEQFIHYNLLMTEEWMLLVPRSKNCYNEISINALGFGGALFVYNSEKLEVIKKSGPFSFLKNVGIEFEKKM